MMGQTPVPMWLYAIYYTPIVGSVLGSGWMLRATAMVPPHLFSRQLWHLALADLLMSLGPPVFAMVVPLLGRIDPQVCNSLDDNCMGVHLYRTATHYLHFTSCLIEAQVAAGVYACATRQTWHGVLGKLLRYTWVFAVPLAIVDFWIMTVSTADQSIFVVGPAPVAAVVCAVSFTVSTLFYIFTVKAVLLTPSPSAVVRRASRRALAYPLSFILTELPPCLQWMGVLQSAKSNMVLAMVVDMFFYSNGWLDATVYSIQNRHLCGLRPTSVRTRFTSPLDESNIPSSASWRVRPGASGVLSFHVGFGAESCRSAPSIANSGWSKEESPASKAAVGVLFHLDTADTKPGEFVYVVAAHSSGLSEKEASKVTVRRRMLTSTSSYPKWGTPCPVWLEPDQSMSDSSTTPSSTSSGSEACEVCKQISWELAIEGAGRVQELCPVGSFNSSELESDDAGISFSSASSASCACSKQAASLFPMDKSNTLFVEYTYIKGPGYPLPGGPMSEPVLEWEAPLRRVSLPAEAGSVWIVSDKQFGEKGEPKVSPFSLPDMLRIHCELDTETAPSPHRRSLAGALSFSPTASTVLPGQMVEPMVPMGPLAAPILGHASPDTASLLTGEEQSWAAFLGDESRIFFTVESDEP